MVAHAPAKVNLALHVTGRRADGYHLLDTLAVFTGFGDVLTLHLAEQDSFSITGAMASGLDPDQSNLVTKARDLLRSHVRFGPVAIRLEKNLPVSSGIGGGSSDAAAALRGLNALFGLGIPTGELAALALPLGADLPMCLHARPLRATGIGEEISLLPVLPGLPMVLANPGVGVSTPAVFKALLSRENPEMDALPALASAEDAAHFVARQRNDLQEAAAALCPAIGQTLAALQTTRPLLARMSGSGATCFGIYATQADADAAARHLASVHPAWFVVATKTLTETCHEPH